MAREPKTHFLKAAEGRTVMLEDGSADWPAEGIRLPETRFIRRRLRDGDLIKAKPAPTPAPAPAADEETSAETTPTASADNEQTDTPAPKAGRKSTKKG